MKDIFIFLFELLVEEGRIWKVYNFIKHLKIRLQVFCLRPLLVVDNIFLIFPALFRSLSLPFVIQLHTEILSRGIGCWHPFGNLSLGIF